MECDVIRIDQVYGLLDIHSSIGSFTVLFYELRDSDVAYDEWDIVIPDYAVTGFVDAVYARPLATGAHTDTEVGTGLSDVGIDPFGR